MRNLKSNRMHGIKAGAYSESKYTNWTNFDPTKSGIDKIYYKHCNNMDTPNGGPKYIQESLHSNFILPVTIQDLKNEYSKLPENLKTGLEGVFLLGGSSKINKTYRRLFRYGTYWNNCIFIHPYPKNWMTRIYEKSPRPHILNDYKRVGAIIEEGLESTVQISFTEKSLRQFYLRDVFIHEIGHHVDRIFKKNHAKSEGFAEWFATEYGFRHKYYEE